MQAPAPCPVALRFTALAGKRSRRHQCCNAACKLGAFELVQRHLYGARGVSSSFDGSRQAFLPTGSGDEPAHILPTFCPPSAPLPRNFLRQGRPDPMLLCGTTPPCSVCLRPQESRRLLGTPAVVERACNASRYLGRTPVTGPGLAEQKGGRAWSDPWMSPVHLKRYAPGWWSSVKASKSKGGTEQRLYG